MLWRLLISLLLAALCGCKDTSLHQALGTLERDRVVLKATANEVITALPIKEGQTVTAGTLLVQLDDRRQMAKVSKAKAEMESAKAQWDQLKNGAREEDIDAAKASVEGAQAEVKVAEKNYTRAKELQDKHLSAASALDQALAARDSANAALKSAEKHLLALTNGTRKETLDQAEAQFKAAKAQWELEKLALNDLSITATRTGYLDALPWNEGERVASGTAVAVLLTDTNAYARVYIPEAWRAKVTVGTEMIVTMDGMAEPLHGKVRWISLEPAFTPYYALNERDRARLMYLAEINLPGDQSLPVGVPVQATLSESP